MGRQDAWGTRRERLPCDGCESIQRIGVEHCGSLPFGVQLANHGLDFGFGSQSWADRQDVFLFLSPELVEKRAGWIEAGCHDARESGCDRVLAFFGSCHGHQSSTGSEGTLPGQDRGPGHSSRSADDESVAEGTLVCILRT